MHNVDYRVLCHSVRALYNNLLISIFVGNLCWATPSLSDDPHRRRYVIRVLSSGGHAS